MACLHPGAHLAAASAVASTTCIDLVQVQVPVQVPVQVSVLVPVQVQVQVLALAILAVLLHPTLPAPLSLNAAKHCWPGCCTVAASYRR